VFYFLIFVVFNFAFCGASIVFGQNRQMQSGGEEMLSNKFLSKSKYIIIGIHGLLNKPPNDQLQKWWSLSIEEGLTRNLEISYVPSFELVYWADVRNPNPIPVQHLDDPYWKMSEEEPLKRYEMDFSDALRSIANKYGGRILDKEKDLIGLGTNVEKILGVGLDDLDDYYKNVEIRKKIRAKLSSAIESNEGRRILVVAHSMGSIVAYDVLRKFDKVNFQNPISLITIGSPLGMPIVSKKIREEFSSTNTPKNVGLWINMSDPGDRVAIDCELEDEYGSNQSGVKVKDVFVHNEYVSPKGEENNHKSYGYLRAPEFSEAVIDFVSIRFPGG
jgi:hypothetical protein